MGKFDGILMVSDLDGTLLKNDKSISQENIDALNYFMAEGGLFTVVTGRMPYALSHVLDKITVNAPIACGNGLIIFDTLKQKYLWKTCIHGNVLSLVRFVMDNFPEVGVEITTHEKILCVRTTPIVLKHLADENLAHEECTLESFDGEIAKLLFAERPEKMDCLIDAVKKSGLAKDYQGLRSDIPYYEILPSGVGKGPLLVKLAEILGVPLKKTVAVGDNDNDATMLSAAGMGIAVSNASERAIAAANLTTVSNEEHALAKIISDIENGIIKL